MGSQSRSGISKLLKILMIDLVIVAFASGGYYYVETIPLPAELIVSDLTVSQEIAEIGDPITISVKVTNVGELAGSYTVNLKIDGVLEGSETVDLSPKSSTTVEFTVTKEEPGVYSVDVNGLGGTFEIKAAPPPPLPAEFILTDLTVSREVAGVGDPITISVKVTNVGELKGSYTVNLKIDGALEGGDRVVYLWPKMSTTVEFRIIKEEIGTYSFDVNGLTGTFEVAVVHRLSVTAKAASGNPITLYFYLNEEQVWTPFSEYLKEGTYTLRMQNPSTQPFAGWEDGSTDPVRTINLIEDVSIVATYLGRSCPSLYVWNGTDYAYVDEVSDGTGYIGILECFLEDGSLKFGSSYPWDYIKLDKSQLQPKDGYYDLIMTQRWDEIFYLDSATLLVVDHSPNVNVYSTEGDWYIDPNFMGKIYTVSKDPLAPISCVNGDGKDCLPQISKLDGVFTNGTSFQYDTLELDLGDLSHAEEIKLLVAGVIMWDSGREQGAWGEQFVNKPGVEIFPYPIMEVKAENGSWIPVPKSRQFPRLDVVPTPFVVDLTGLFPTNDYSLRISTFMNTIFDYIGIDITPQEDVIIHTINPASADLYKVFEPNTASSGNFTRYGDVTSLILEVDDKFVIGRQGDEIHVKFPSDLPPPPENMERDYFLFATCWFKISYYFFMDFTVDPMPFYNMSTFLYPPSESYPYDEDHLEYLMEYNTREIEPPQTFSSSVSSELLSVQLLVVFSICFLLLGETMVRRWLRRKLSFLK